jgi:hypothetical protein
MRHVRTTIVQADFGVARQFERSLACAMVCYRELAHFRGYIRRDTDLPEDFDVSGVTAEFGPVSMKGVFVNI